MFSKYICKSNCPMRSVTCHSSCPTYAKYKKNLKLVNDKKNFEKEYNGYVFDTIVRFRGY